MQLTRLTLSIATALALGMATVHAQVKVATVDMKKAFETYYKTKQATSQVEEHVKESEKTLKAMFDDHGKGTEEYKKLLDAANDQAVSSEERARRKEIAEKKLIEIQDIEKSVAQFRRTTQANIQERNKRMRDGIVKDIRDIVNRKSKAAGYTLVFDSSGDTFNQTPVILYQDYSIDLTEDVIKELNKDAPAELLKPDAGAATTPPPAGDAKN